ncbi:MAG TPA: DUF3137 domain-containing protein [Terricaulis sp.]|nr:DUF3137 domain-containing protein [Terricaulis sp.]
MTDSAPEEAVDLARLDEASFARIYKDRIEPFFISNEADRLEAVKIYKQRMALGISAALAVAIAAFILSGREWGLTLVLGLFAGGAAAVWAYQPLGKVGRRLKQQYCQSIAEAMGADFAMGDFAPPAFERLRELKLVPSFARSKFEDHFSGAYKGASFDLYEAHLEQRRTDSKGRTRYDTVFRGQLVRMHFPRDFLGVTIVRRDAGVFNAFGGGQNNGRKLERVRLVDAALERAFEVWSTDQVEARYLIHPVMMERLMGLEKGLHGKRLRCAFEGGDLLVAVEGGNLFEPGDLFKPLVDPARARRIVNELAGVFQVMDQVLTAQTQRLP